MVNTVLLLTNGSLCDVNLNSEADLDNFQDRSVFKTTGTSKLRKLTEWSIFDTTMVMYGWSKGEAGTENHHDLPPPVDSELYFGDILAVLVDNNGSIQDLTEVTYRDFYEKQFGGFEDLGETSGDESLSQSDSEQRDDASDFVPGDISSTESSESGQLEETDDEQDHHTSESEYSDLVESEDEATLAKELFEELETERSQAGDGFTVYSNST